MNPHIIFVDNPIQARCDASLARLINPCLSFKAFFYRQGMYKKERKEYDKSLLVKGTRGSHYFWAGLLNRVLEYCVEQGINVRVEDTSQEKYEMYEPELPGITFRDDQLRLINSFLDSPRGILESFTGSGKTVLGFGCLSSFVDVKILWLCHKKDLMQQAYDEAIRFGFDAGRIGDGFDEKNHDVTVATRQSFRRLADEFGHEYDIVVVDEVHHVTDLKSEYAYVLTRVPAPIRLGLTATMHPPNSEAWLTCVGLIGPILEQLTINEGNELGILAKPKIKILRTEKDYKIADMRQYSAVYDAAVVNRLARNVLIATTAKKHIEAGETVLIMINQIEHGENILTQLKALGCSAEFVRGSTEGEARNQIKHALNNKHLHCVICSSVWTEGVNIPTLNVVINAAGGKAEIRTLQAIGRGLRKTDEKDVLIYYDIYDNSHRYLIEHFGERLCIYLDSGWI